MSHASLNETNKFASEEIFYLKTNKNPNLRTQTSIATISINNRAKIEKREKLTVSPKFMNIGQYKSFQLNCVYTGPHFSSINLIWQKDNHDLDLNQKDQQRLLALNYKQNNTSICILKFSYALRNDAGLYKCLTQNQNHLKHHYLVGNDTISLVVNLGIYFCF